MKDVSGKIAVLTGGGTGMGRELARSLTKRGCHVAICDVMEHNMLETKKLCEREMPAGTRVTTHLADVSDEKQVSKFRDDVASEMETQEINYLFNNAGIAGGGSMFTDSRESWERTFNICWYGVYYNVRAFMPMLINAAEAHIVNTSSINGLWATVGPGTPHTAYAAAKFAVRGFTEALLIDTALNAPHIKCSVVFPGHVGTDVFRNSRMIQQGILTDTLTAAETARYRERLVARGHDERELTDSAIQVLNDASVKLISDAALTTSAEAAEIILNGVLTDQWRILIGEDARIVDDAVRANPVDAYSESFFLQNAPAFAREGYCETGL